MTSLNNLEKLIQMATIEHMYSMLQKISINNNLSEINIPSSYARCLMFKKQFPKLLYSPEIESRLTLLKKSTNLL